VKPLKSTSVDPEIRIPEATQGASMDLSAARISQQLQIIHEAE
jgi:hypothetical protein